MVPSINLMRRILRQQFLELFFECINQNLIRILIFENCICVFNILNCLIHHFCLFLYLNCFVHFVQTQACICTSCVLWFVLFGWSSNFSRIQQLLFVLFSFFLFFLELLSLFNTFFV